MNLGDFLQQHLKSRRLNSRTLAQQAGVSESVISNLLRVGTGNGHKKPDPATLLAVAKALEVSPSLLFQLAGYLPAEEAGVLSPMALYLARLFDSLSPDLQRLLFVILNGVVQHYREEGGEGDGRRI